MDFYNLKKLNDINGWLSENVIGIPRHSCTTKRSGEKVEHISLGLPYVYIKAHQCLRYFGAQVGNLIDFQSDDLKPAKTRIEEIDLLQRVYGATIRPYTTILKEQGMVYRNWSDVSQEIKAINYQSSDEDEVKKIENFKKDEDLIDWIDQRLEHSLCMLTEKFCELEQVSMSYKNEKITISNDGILCKRGNKVTPVMAVWLLQQTKKCVLDTTIKSNAIGSKLVKKIRGC